MTVEFEHVIQNEARLEALRQTSLIDSPPEEAFDRLTRMAAAVLHVPVALVALVDRDRQFFKSEGGRGEPLANWRSNPLTYSFCKFTVGMREPFVISDARQEPRLGHHPTVVELWVIAYAGVPLMNAEGHPLGTFCVVDTEP